MLFHTCLTDLRIVDGGPKAVQLNGEQWLDTDYLVLAVGHSARDTFRWLNRAGIPMEQKAFSLGARIEHLQTEIDRAQYGGFAGHPAFGAAPYKLAVHLRMGGGCIPSACVPAGRWSPPARRDGGHQRYELLCAGRNKREFCATGRCRPSGFWLRASAGGDAFCRKKLKNKRSGL